MTLENTKANEEEKEVNIGGWVAYGALNAAVAIASMLTNELVNADATGDYSGVSKLISIIESWANSPNEEERKAYKIFMKHYKKLYKKALEKLQAN